MACRIQKRETDRQADKQGYAFISVRAISNWLRGPLVGLCFRLSPSLRLTIRFTIFRLVVLAPFQLLTLICLDGQNFGRLVGHAPVCSLEVTTESPEAFGLQRSGMIGALPRPVL